MRFAPWFLAALITLSPMNTAQGQSTEEKFQDLFVTAGYCTALGAALGTAMLAWTEDPTANLRFVAMGASLGFFGGSFLGSYIIFSPGLTDLSEGQPGSTIAQAPADGVMIRPMFHRGTQKLVSLEAGWTVLHF